MLVTAGRLNVIQCFLSGPHSLFDQSPISGKVILTYTVFNLFIINCYFDMSIPHSGHEFGLFDVQKAANFLDFPFNTFDQIF